MNNEKIGKIMKKIKKAQRLNSVLPSPIRKTFAIANAMKSRGEKILDFGIGDIDIGCPRVIREAIKQAVNEGN